MDSLEEIWKRIIENGIITNYEASNHGTVKSFQNGQEIINVIKDFIGNI